MLKKVSIISSLVLATILVFSMAIITTSSAAVTGKTMGIIGEFCGWNWNNAVEMTEEPAGSGIYVATVDNFTGGQFKFCEFNNWGGAQWPSSGNYSSSLNGKIKFTLNTTDNTYTEVEVEPAPTYETALGDTIYFDNTNNWSVVKAYFWIEGSPSPFEWPGFDATNIEGTNVYSYTFDTADTVGMNRIIFNNGSGGDGNQTGNLIYQGPDKIYRNGTWEDYTPPVTEKFTVTFVDSNTGDVLSTQEVESGQSATVPTDLPQYRDHEYLPDFQVEDLENITVDTEFTYTLTGKMFNVTASDPTDLQILSGTETASTFGYGTIAKAVYTGPNNVIGWQINSQTVSATTSKEYAFYVNDNAIVSPVFEGETEKLTKGMFIASVAFATDKDTQKAKIYYSMFATGFTAGDTVDYGVYRSTNPGDLIDAQIEIEQYLQDEEANANANIKEHNVMNEDGRYNYVAVVPTDIDETLSLSVVAWISINGVVTLSEVSQVHPGTLA